jgi:hypothetical protein
MGNIFLCHIYIYMELFVHGNYMEYYLCGIYLQWWHTKQCCYLTMASSWILFHIVNNYNHTGNFYCHNLDLYSILQLHAYDHGKSLEWASFWSYYYFQFSSWGWWGTEKAINFPWITQLVRIITLMQMYTVWI